MHWRCCSQKHRYFCQLLWMNFHESVSVIGSGAYLDCARHLEVIVEIKIATCWALASLAFVSSITPGPNNFMLMASGMRFGLPKTLPHLFGVASGFGVLLLFTDLALGYVADRFALIAPLLAIACALYLAWLAFKLLRASKAPLDAASPSFSQKPMTMPAAMLFQWVNPKAWTMAVAGAVMAQQFELPAPLRASVLVVIYVAINLPCVLVWAAAGSQMRRWLAVPAVAQAFNVVMALALLITAGWMIAPELTHY
jgi:threonine/homoserine/homoserine lactone efflux protein